MEDAPFFVKHDAASFTATITLSRPERGNRFMTEDVSALGRAIRESGADSSVKAVIIRAQGEHFCLGRDPGPASPKTKSALAIRTSVTEPILELYADIRATPVPVVAVVQGEARGLGCALVGQCDLSIAAEGAMFSLPEMDTNLPPTLAISAVLGKMPPKRLMHLIYTRAKIGAAEALALGLLSEVVPAAEIDSAVAATLARLTDRSRPALAAVKEYLAVAPHMDPHAASRYASTLLSVVLSSKDET
jgi:enoyl-CoA hydratase/carnithine racemase